METTGENRWNALLRITKNNSTEIKVLLTVENCKE